MIDRFFIFFIFFLFSFGQLGRISLLNQEINFYLYEAFMGLYFLYFFITYKFDPVLKFFKKNQLILLSFLYFLFSFLLNLLRYQMKENLIAFLYLFRIIFYFTFFIYFYFHYKKRELKQIIVLRINIFVFLTITFSLVQYFLYPNLRNIVYLGWDPHWYRMLGVFFDSFLAAAIYGLLAIFFFYKKLIFFSLIFFVFIIFSFSRNIYLALIIITILHFWLSKKFKEIFFFLIILLFAVFAAPKPFGESVNLKRIFTIEARLNDYKQAFAIWKKNPIFGIGYNHIGDEKKMLDQIKTNFGYSHALRGFSSSFLIVLVSGGILGLVFFVFLIKKILLINSFSFWGGLFLLLASFFDNVILHPMIIFIYFYLILLS